MSVITAPVPTILFLVFYHLNSYILHTMEILGMVFKNLYETINEEDKKLKLRVDKA